MGSENQHHEITDEQFQKLLDRRDEILDDERITEQPDADVRINAPLAIEQITGKARLRMLNMFIGIIDEEEKVDLGEVLDKD